MKIATAATVLALAAFMAGACAAARAETAPSQKHIAQSSSQSSTEVSSQRRRDRRPRPRVRIFRENEGVYPRYFPGRNAVRECNATYVQEFRPSGTVIVPRVNCFWRPG